MRGYRSWRTLRGPPRGRVCSPREGPRETPGASEQPIRRQSSYSVRGSRRSQARTANPCGTAADPKPERRFRAGLSTIPGQTGDSVRDCRRSQARTAIPCGTVADPSPERRFRMRLSTIPSRNGDSVWNCRRSQARTAILCESGVVFDRGGPNSPTGFFWGLGGKFRVILIYRALPRGRV